MSRYCFCNMNEYLETTIEKLRSGEYAGVSVVMGNESCDLDSAVSALVYAMFLRWQHRLLQCKVCTRSKRAEDAKEEIFVPVLNVQREDYELKTEVAHVLAQHHIPHTLLVFRDDACLISALRDARVTLVDHHVLCARDAELAPLVAEVIDHRPLDRRRWGFREDARCTVQAAGSCASLVARRVLELSALSAGERDFFAECVPCCDMLHSAIILDTANFCKDVDKATAVDEEMVQMLESILRPADCAAERASKLVALVAARRDVGALGAAQLLRKDLKVLGDALVPSFPILVKEFLSRPGALEAVSEALGPRSIALLLGMELTGSLTRDAAVYCADDSVRDELCAFLQAWRPPLDLSPDQLAEQSAEQSADLSGNLRYFSQRNLSASRKQYMPALEAFLARQRPPTPS